MRVDVVHRMLVSVGLSAIALVGLGMTTNAQGQQEQGWQEDQKDADQDRAWGPQQEPTRQESTKQEQPRAEAEQQDLIRQHELRLPQYREVLNQQEQVAEQRAANYSDRSATHCTAISRSTWRTYKSSARVSRVVIAMICLRPIFLQTLQLSLSLGGGRYSERISMGSICCGRR